MKRIQNKAIALTLALTMSLGLTFTPNSTQFNAKAQVVIEDFYDDVFGPLVVLFCPETPKKVCKGSSCEQGACISFRKHCTTDKDCVN